MFCCGGGFLRVLGRIATVNIEAVAALISALIAGAALIASWFAWRSSELRRDHVHQWGNEAIRELQSVELVCCLPSHLLAIQRKREIMEEAVFRTSILIEQGRLFFKNSVIDDFGAEKASAYRGYRPKLLDELVVAHQIAVQWPEIADTEQVRDVGEIASAAKREFVSLLQKEVGRQRTVSAETGKGGSGADLDYRLDEITLRRS